MPKNDLHVRLLPYGLKYLICHHLLHDNVTPVLTTLYGLKCLSGNFQDFLGYTHLWLLHVKSDEMANDEPVAVDLSGFTRLTSLHLPCRHSSYESLWKLTRLRTLGLKDNVTDGFLKNFPYLKALSIPDFSSELHNFQNNFLSISSKFDLITPVNQPNILFECREPMLGYIEVDFVYVNKLTKLRCHGLPTFKTGFSSISLHSMDWDAITRLTSLRSLTIINHSSWMPGIVPHGITSLTNLEKLVVPRCIIRTTVILELPRLKFCECLYHIVDSKTDCDCVIAERFLK